MQFGIQSCLLKCLKQLWWIISRLQDRVCISGQIFTNLLSAYQFILWVPMKTKQSTILSSFPEISLMLLVRENEKRGTLPLLLNIFKYQCNLQKYMSLSLSNSLSQVEQIRQVVFLQGFKEGRKQQQRFYLKLFFYSRSGREALLYHTLSWGSKNIKYIFSVSLLLGLTTV